MSKPTPYRQKLGLQKEEFLVIQKLLRGHALTKNEQELRRELVAYWHIEPSGACYPIYEFDVSFNIVPTDERLSTKELNAKFFGPHWNETVP